MELLLLFVGFALFFLGVGYLFKPQWILRFNAFFRDTFFKDSVVLLSNRKVGMLLVLLAFILLVFTLKDPR
jgi:hypothetical protein